MLLSALWNGESMSQTELAEWLAVTPATLTVSLRPLEKAGLVQRRRDPDDQRVVRVSATRAGLEMRKQILAKWRELDRRTVKGLTAKEQAMLDELLVRVAGNISEDR